ncbi:MAG: hypothetical protein BZ137_00235 [Methanosphaera sp. rholeuAM130]|nr:MAG: hypothetical protein BZ137_00235 [Methanosphaera sp. rholeuAM130]
MKSNLTLKVTNLGPIEEADMTINQINVIGGVNGSGKSTLSKLLYCYISANTLEGDYIVNNQVKLLFDDFINFWSRNIENENNLHNYIIFKSLLDDWNNDESSYDYFIKKYDDVKEYILNSKLKNNTQCTDNLENIGSVIKSYKNRELKYYQVVNFLLSTEYDLFQLKNYSNAHVEFNGEYDGKTFNLSTNFRENSATSNFEGYSDCITYRQMIYIDSPSVLDLYNNNHSYHYNFLYNSVTNTSNNLADSIYHRKQIEFSDEIKDLLNGEFIYDSEKGKFLFIPENGTEIEMKNTASGFKQMGIIQLLLSTKTLTQNCFLIIDEPEINLHQEMQVKFAYLLVKMSKELNVTLYINSHSPLFIEAMEVYISKYDLENETSFYLTQKNDNNKYVFEEIPLQKLHRIYDNIGNPYEVINKVRYENLQKKNL